MSEIYITIGIESNKMRLIKKYAEEFENIEVHIEPDNFEVLLALRDTFIHLIAAIKDYGHQN